MKIIISILVASLIPLAFFVEVNSSTEEEVIKRPPTYLPDSVKIWWDDIVEATRGTLLSPEWVAAQMIVESCGHPFICSESGACGVMQFMPITAEERHLDPLDPYESIINGVGYLEWTIVNTSDYSGIQGIQWGLAGYVQGPTGIIVNGWSSDAVWYVDTITKIETALSNNTDAPALKSYRDGQFCVQALGAVTWWFESGQNKMYKN